MNSLFEQFFNDFFQDTHGISRVVKDGKLVYSIDVPGFNESNLDVEYKNDYVIVKGDTKERSINKVIHVDKRSVPNKASVKDGVLTLKFQIDKALEGKKIAIEQG